MTSTRSGIGSSQLRKFIGYMVTMLTAGDDAKPTPQEQKWLLIIKRKLEEKK